uniref:Uncharacterized protein n=1 Tax=Chlorocebus sabaeus TaxID=60711 RepID=A0A0D9S4B1_CHLSB
MTGGIMLFTDSLRSLTHPPNSAPFLFLDEGKSKSPRAGR